MTTARSYCSGYGGLEMSVRAVFGDFEVLSHSDIKPASQRLLAHHYPHIPNLGDMRAIDYTALERPDLMIGSWPCQPHSAAGKRLGEADPRDLWPEYERAIDAHRPAIFFGENVARIASNGELRRVVRSLAQRGYVGAWRSVRASDVGACHRRDRMFIVAADALGEVGRFSGYAEQGDGAGAAGFGSAESGRRDLRPLTLLPTPKATDGTKGGPGMRGSSGDLMLPSAVMQLLPTPNVADSRNTRNATAGRTPENDRHHSGWTLSDVAYLGDSDGNLPQARPDQALRDLRRADDPQAVRQAAGGPGGIPAAPTLREGVRGDQGGSEARDAPLASSQAPQADVREVRNGRGSARAPQGPGSDEQRPVQPGNALLDAPSEMALALGSALPACGCAAWGHYAPAVHRHELALGRPAPLPTQVSLRNSRPQLSARAVEWMMMVPEGHVTGVPGLVDSPRKSERNAMLSLLGDGVVPAQGAAAFRFLLAHLAQRLAAGVAA